MTDACPCTRAAVVTVEWECAGGGHYKLARLCRDHGAIQVAALLSDVVMCGLCRRDGYERAVMLLRVNGRRVSSRLGRRAP